MATNKLAKIRLYPYEPKWRKYDDTKISQNTVHGEAFMIPFYKLPNIYLQVYKDSDEIFLCT